MNIKMVYLTDLQKNYNLKRLVYFEVFNRVEDGILREKRLKKWNRQWKIELLEKDNPDLLDLYKQILSGS
jgi:putative endonuclease